MSDQDREPSPALPQLSPALGSIIAEEDREGSNQQAVVVDGAPGDDGDGDDEQQQQQLLPLLQQQQEQQQQPPFEAVFTLLTNSTIGTTVHPRVRYLFSDDDASILTEPQQQGDPSHRTLVVDLAVTAEANRHRWTVSSAASLSPDFAVTGSELTVQQQVGEGNTDGSDGDGGGGGGGGPTSLKLRVEGVEREPVNLRQENLRSSGSGSSGAAISKDDPEGLAEEFRRRMEVLKKVVSAGEKRQQNQGGGSVEMHGGSSEEVAVRSHEAEKPESSGG